MISYFCVNPYNLAIDCHKNTSFITLPTTVRVKLTFYPHNSVNLSANQYIAGTFRKC